MLQLLQCNYTSFLMIVTNYTHQPNSICMLYCNTAEQMEEWRETLVFPNKGIIQNTY